ncbi:hypothetical protein BJ165DRAFT_1451918 [Panaeolus papilionaceus]|nr:hypothetical protein BJ165DRAFT_1451918 [Panaeolus papilionaceus]
MVSHNQFCTKGAFIRFPHRPVDGHTGKWSLCANITAGGRHDLVYELIPNHPHYDGAACEEFYVETITWSQM